jgi:prevent-host-death family protein
MANLYSIREAKAKFSEVIRKVRAGQRIRIAYRGEEIAEIRPLDNGEVALEMSLRRMEEQGVLGRPKKPVGTLRPLAKKPGALARFLEERG